MLRCRWRLRTTALLDLTELFADCIHHWQRPSQTNHAGLALHHIGIAHQHIDVQLSQGFDIVAKRLRQGPLKKRLPIAPPTRLAIAAQDRATGFLDHDRAGDHIP